MAGHVALSQALSYARDLKCAYEVARARERELVQANDRLRRGYEQSLQFAVDLKKTYRRLERAIFRSAHLANALEARTPIRVGIRRGWPGWRRSPSGLIARADRRNHRAGGITS
jgi:hypothetical protein